MFFMCLVLFGTANRTLIDSFCFVQAERYNTDSVGHYTKDFNRTQDINHANPFLIRILVHVTKSLLLLSTYVVHTNFVVETFL